jgi:2-polyprenyl-3-methyl-5-hydroxy-6-metoxy-1,4-benzoquinol methylase
MDRGEHWDRVYTDKADTALTWFQPEPSLSLALLDALHIEPGASVVDVGAGASRLVDALLDRGFDDITLLDVAGSALEVTRRRLGPRGTQIQWIAADVLAWHPDRQFDVWHDRAAFHFFVDPIDRTRYVDVVKAAVSVGGHVLIATFAPDGPEHCSGLPTARYDTESLSAVFDDSFVVADTRREEHRSPAGTMQPFTWTAFTRV